MRLWEKRSFKVIVTAFPCHDKCKMHFPSDTSLFLQAQWNETNQNSILLSEHILHFASGNRLFSLWSLYRVACFKHKHRNTYNFQVNFALGKKMVPKCKQAKLWSYLVAATSVKFLSVLYTLEDQSKIWLFLPTASCGATDVCMWLKGGGGTSADGNGEAAKRGQCSVGRGKKDNNPPCRSGPQGQCWKPHTLIITSLNTEQQVFLHLLWSKYARWQMPLLYTSHYKQL